MFGLGRMMGGRWPMIISAAMAREKPRAVQGYYRFRNCYAGIALVRQLFPSVYLFFESGDFAILFTYAP
jgi:hypothetical protein